MAFYAKHFGWSQAGSMPMGEMGDYKFLQHDGVSIGGVMPKPPQMSRAAWTFYVGVDDIDRAAAAITEGGGQIISGPHEIPGGEISIDAFDPAGAHFGLVGPRKQ
ncbi:VOC family protein [Sphingomonas sp. HDW15A]|uniref:VOC family protein n=1 Tax=Sphingomonas sp. HDW15A TaxID=2714942 RepID=UPI001F10FF9A|nr:VOC family protein [Sphingomonas sp. HDW15A]